MTNAESRLK